MQISTKEARQRLANCGYKVEFGYIQPGATTFRTFSSFEPNTMRVHNQRDFKMADFDISIGNEVDGDIIQKLIHRGHIENP